MDPVTLGMAKADARKKFRPLTADPKGAIGLRTVAGRIGTIDNSAANTFQVTAELPCHADAIQLVIVNTQPRFSDVAYIAKAIALPSASDLNGSAGTWTSITKAGQSQFLIETGVQSVQPGYTLTDMVPLHTVERSDDGTNPIVAVRVWVSGNASLPAVGNGSDDFTNWAAREDGLLWAMRHQSGNQVTTPSGFASTTNRSQSPILGIRFLARGQVKHVAWIGDSISEGRGTYLGEGFVLPAVQNLSTPAKTLSASCFGWSGQTTNYITDRAIDLIESPLRPDVLVLPCGSPNDQPTTLTEAGIALMKTNLLRTLAACKAHGVTPVVWTMLPVNTAVNAWGSSDELRVAYNAEVLSSGLLVADAAAAVSGSTSGSQVQMAAGSTTDGIHPNDDGNALLTPVIQAVLAEAI